MERTERTGRNGDERKGGRWFWVRQPDGRALLEVGQKCPFCGRWALQGVYFASGLPEPDGAKVCACGTRMMPAVVDLGRQELVAAVV